MTEQTDLEIKPTQAGQQTAKEVLEVIRNRSFSGRHPELGKMIKCVYCGSRHRENERKCEQKFATGRYDLRDPKPLLIASQTTIKGVMGAASLKGKRIKPHPNKRKLQFIELVRSFVPDEYDQDDLKKARAKATRILIRKLGRYKIAPPRRQQKEN